MNLRNPESILLDIFTAVREDDYEEALKLIAQLKNFKESGGDMSLTLKVFDHPVPPVEGYPLCEKYGYDDDANEINWPLGTLAALYPEHTLFGIPHWDSENPTTGLVWFNTFFESGWGCYMPGHKIWLNRYSLTYQQAKATGPAATVIAQFAGGGDQEGLILYVHEDGHPVAELPTDGSLEFKVDRLVLSSDGLHIKAYRGEDCILCVKCRGCALVEPVENSPFTQIDIEAEDIFAKIAVTDPDWKQS